MLNTEDRLTLRDSSSSTPLVAVSRPSNSPPAPSSSVLSFQARRSPMVLVCLVLLTSSAQLTVLSTSVL